MAVAHCVDCATAGLIEFGPFRQQKIAHEHDACRPKDRHPKSHNLNRAHVPTRTWSIDRRGILEIFQSRTSRKDCAVQREARLIAPMLPACDEKTVPFQERTAQSMASKNGGLTLRERKAIYKAIYQVEAHRRPPCTQHRKSSALASPASRHPALVQRLR
jgi:hypothetical protein